MVVLLFLLGFLILFCGRYKISNDISINAINKKLFFCYFLFLFIFITCFRFNVGYDYHTYYSYLVKKNLWAENFFEPIPRMLLIFSRKIRSPLLFFVVINGTILLLVISSIKTESVDIYESFVIFISLFYLNTLSIVRQWLALALILYSFKYIRRKRFLHYFVFVLLATMCHTSAILSISIYFIYNYIPAKISFFFSFLGLAIGKKLLSIVFSIPFLLPYSHYFSSLYIRGSTKSIFIWYILYVFVLGIYLKSKEKEKIERLFSIVCYGIVFPALLGPSMGSRVSIYFNIFYLFLLPLCFEKLRPTYLRKFFMIPFYVYYVLILFVDSMNDQGYTRYILYFFKDGLSMSMCTNGVLV